MTSDVEQAAQNERPVSPESDATMDRGGESESCAGSIRFYMETLVPPGSRYYNVRIESRICPVNPWVVEQTFTQATLNSQAIPVPFNVRHDREYRITVDNLTGAGGGGAIFRSGIISQNTILTPSFWVPVFQTRTQGYNGRTSCGYPWLYNCGGSET